LDHPKQNKNPLPMSGRENIKTKVIEAMHAACDDALYFSDDLTQQIDAEYLLTVHVAKKIAELNTCFGEPFKIYLERQTRVFATDCILLFGEKSLSNRFGSAKIRLPKNTQRNGKIDVTIYHGTPLCAIELKGFTSKKAAIKKDLERNVEYFNLRCQTGRSLIKFTIFAGLESHPKTYTRADTQKNIARIRRKYENWLSEIKIDLSIHVEILAFTIRDYIDEDCHPLVIGDDFSDRRHHFVGVVVTFSSQNFE
jgi:hypothetical protein